MGKRIFDIFVSVLLLLPLFPVLLVVAFAIKISSDGPIFYRGVRVGRNQRPFNILKFRSMVTNAEALGGSSTSDADPRLTAVGRIIRNYKIDELPQLLNVIRGDMSLVGPRPQVQDYACSYTHEEKQIFNVRPGITDWASIWNSKEGAFLARYANPDLAYTTYIHPTKIKLQREYVANQSFLVDLKILASTLVRLFLPSWTPRELRPYPALAGQPCVAQPNYRNVTETPGTPVNHEQLDMLHTRYSWASEHTHGKEVLEVACGSGIGLGYLARDSKRVVGGDCDESLVNLCRKTYGDRISIKALNAESLPFEPSTFDVVILFEAIYYLPNPTAFFREAHRVLRPNGVLLLCSANCERDGFNRSPMSTGYPTCMALVDALASNGFKAEAFVAFPTVGEGRFDRLLEQLRKTAVRLQLLPQTMKWKARIKRLVFRRMTVLPTEITLEYDRKRQLSCVSNNQNISGFKVFYIRGTREDIDISAAA